MIRLLFANGSETSIGNANRRTVISAMPRVLLNFQHYGNHWQVHFIEEDCQTFIGLRTRYFRFTTVESLRRFVIRCCPEDICEFDRSLRAWGRGSNYVYLTGDQYARIGGRTGG